jgi:hypothetical protein
MAKGRKRKDSADENVEAYRHETETRKNVVPVRLASYDASTPKPKIIMTKAKDAPDTDLKVIERLQQLGWRLWGTQRTTWH